MCFVISCSLLLMLLFSLPEYTRAMSQDVSSSSSLLGALPQGNSEQLKRMLGSLLNLQPGIAQPVFAPTVTYFELDLSLAGEITAELLRDYASTNSKIKRLRISGLVRGRSLINGDLLRVVVDCFPDLEELDISYSDLEAEDLRMLSLLKSLRRLSINSTRITDAGIQVLVDVGIAAQLTHLELNSTNLRDSSVIETIIKHFKALTHLSIAGNYIYPSAISKLEERAYEFLNAEGNLGDPQKTLEYLKAYNDRSKKSKN